MENDKQVLRQKMLSLLSSLSPEEKNAQSDKACKKFLASSYYDECEAVLSYIPLKDELDVSLINEQALRDKKTLAFPVCVSRECEGGKKNTLLFYEVNPCLPLKNQIVRKSLCFEPDKKILKPFCLCEKTCVIVPGVAFTKNGQRLGRGKGFYDGFLEDARKTVFKKLYAAGICFDIQITQTVFAEAHDQRLDAIFASQQSIP